MYTRKRSNSITILFQFLSIVLLGGILGVCANILRNDRIPLIAKKSYNENVEGQISLSEAKEKFDSGMGFFIDSRPESAYRQGHILNALSLPEEDFEEKIEEVKELIPDDKEFTLIIYCGGEVCESSVKLANKLKEYGYSNIRVFQGGWNEWVKAGYPVENTSP